MLTAAELNQGLANFFGTEKYHRLTLDRRLVATDGVAWLAKNACCYWLVDIIASYQPQMLKKQRTREFQAWEMKVDLEKKTAVVIGMDDTTPVIKQEIESTDFPLAEIKFFVERADENLWVLMLPNEH